MAGFSALTGRDHVTPDILTYATHFLEPTYAIPFLYSQDGPPAVLR